MKKKRLYSLFWKRGRSWKRVSQTCFHKDKAVLVWQDTLLASCAKGLHVALRPCVPSAGFSSFTGADCPDREDFVKALRGLAA